MPNSWFLDPCGTLRPLTATQDLLIELVPVVEDMTDACQQLRVAIAECAPTRDEARRLVVRSRRQRLGLQLVVSESEVGDE